MSGQAPPPSSAEAPPRPDLWTLVVLISCAHALVHTYELSLPTVEVLIAEEYFPAAAARHETRHENGSGGGASRPAVDVDVAVAVAVAVETPTVETPTVAAALPAGGEASERAEAAGKHMTGRLAAAWRLPFGFGALLAGWLIDRWGTRRLLLLYLLGCSATAGVAGWVAPLSGLFVTMFAMGACASIYHPAGLTMISQMTPESLRPRALGLHGIFGSAGIAAAPFATALALDAGLSWRQLYGVLAFPGVALAVALWRRLPDDPTGKQQRAEEQRAEEQRAEEQRAEEQRAEEQRAEEQRAEEPRSEEPRAEASRSGTAALSPSRAPGIQWGAFLLLTGVALLQGWIYAGVMAFLPRYLSGAIAGDAVAGANRLSSGVLLVGCVGQYLAGRWARVRILEWQLMAVTFGAVPWLLAMAWAPGGLRIAAAGAFTVIHFMHQPLYNSLVARYTPQRRRSLCYGFSFALSFGLGGSVGALTVAGAASDHAAYTRLAAVGVIAGAVAAALVRHEARKRLRDVKP